ncbi:S-methyl-5-thioribose-1-phosphate isomerase [Arachnomyces sp. PD_36]|nr:S-methyl-5-thioribose-1-phosphate isomerase [Arachnomyces sp. PD_36]
MVLQAIKYENGHLSILDQLQIPHVQKYVDIQTAEDGWHAIKDMKVRGAPAIAMVAALSLSAEIHTLITKGELPAGAKDTEEFIVSKLGYLETSRPTAVNLHDAAVKLGRVVREVSAKEGTVGKDVAGAYMESAEKMMTEDVKTNELIGHYGNEWIMKNTTQGQEGQKVGILTHCNTGSLATAGYGTALGVIRALHSSNNLDHAYCTETRPYNQGSRLTSFELVHDNIPATLITDSMAAALLARKNKTLGAIVVGADRVAENGDTANKIGTYGLAVLAKHHGVKFLVAAPTTTVDVNTASGSDIVIEERPKSEVTKIKGLVDGGDGKGGVALETISIAADGIDVWNPAFDITPAALIDGVITEQGVRERAPDGSFHLAEAFGA